MDGKGRAMDYIFIERFCDPCNTKNYIFTILEISKNRSKIWSRVLIFTISSALINHWLTKPLLRSIGVKIYPE
ncbi:MAG: hypothetical protein C4548_01390 [Desulfobacteraceae bacterium]|nr:MAG: hypothetical protein C4548_01390 [Desulfobacteraceae bacterium]